ncbi:MAG: DUF4160 domain-containing protein [Spirochaetales bacterium]|nr:DUF4160 domain-containing protein [Spirochaetales bacterium]
MHVHRKKFVAKFWLDPIVLAKGGGFSPAEPRTLFRIVDANRTIFLEK